MELQPTSEHMIKVIGQGTTGHRKYVPQSNGCFNKLFRASFRDWSSPILSLVFLPLSVSLQYSRYSHLNYEGMSTLCNKSLKCINAASCRARNLTGHVRKCPMMQRSTQHEILNFMQTILILRISVLLRFNFFFLTFAHAQFHFLSYSWSRQERRTYLKRYKIAKLKTIGRILKIISIGWLARYLN